MRRHHGLPSAPWIGPSVPELMSFRTSTSLSASDKSTSERLRASCTWPSRQRAISMPSLARGSRDHSFDTCASLPTTRERKEASATHCCRCDRCSQHSSPMRGSIHHSVCTVLSHTLTHHDRAPPAALLETARRSDSSGLAPADGAKVLLSRATHAVQSAEAEAAISADQSVGSRQPCTAGMHKLLAACALASSLAVSWAAIASSARSSAAWFCLHPLPSPAACTFASSRAASTSSARSSAPSFCAYTRPLPPAKHALASSPSPAHSRAAIASSARSSAACCWHAGSAMKPGLQNAR
mmetsp:Transcript_26902/g.62821  ORF Transcript_26902/g.62821 Transcript_26902/m.62821 type:complete len:297 (-) Transcript_26902:50-940(-)